MVREPSERGQNSQKRVGRWSGGGLMGDRQRIRRKKKYD